LRVNSEQLLLINENERETKLKNKL